MNRIKELRSLRKMNQRDLAIAVNVSQAALSGYETEKFEADLVTYIKIADYFGVTLDYLLCHQSRSDDTAKNGKGVPMLSAEEQSLLSAYRQAGDETKAAVRRVLNLKEPESRIASEKAM